MLKQWLSVVKSVLASFLGVQSHSNYVKDMNMPSFMPFLIVGVIMVGMLILTVYLLVTFLVASH